MSNINKIAVNGKEYNIVPENDHIHNNKTVLDKIVNKNDNKKYVMVNGELKKLKVENEDVAAKNLCLDILMTKQLKTTDGTTYTDNSPSLGYETLSGACTLEIVKVEPNNAENTTTLTLNNSVDSDEEEYLFDHIKVGDKCCVRTSNEFDNISIVSFPNAQTIVVDTIITPLKNNDPYANYICFVNLPVLVLRNCDVSKTPFAFSEGESTMAIARAAHSEGRDTKAIGQYGHSEGRLTIAGYAAHSEGYITNAIGNMAHSEGHKTNANGGTSHAEGGETVANGNKSHVEGFRSVAQGDVSHSEGHTTTANGKSSHTEGYKTTAENEAAHAEGHSTKSAGIAAHSEGQLTEARGWAAHAEGMKTIASGNEAHSEGTSTKAAGNNSHTEGLGTIANGDQQHVQGKYNVIDNDNKYAHIVGNGTSDADRSNAHTVDWSGNAWFAGNVYTGANNTKLVSETDLAKVFGTYTTNSLIDGITCAIKVDIAYKGFIERFVMCIDNKIVGYTAELNDYLTVSSVALASDKVCIAFYGVNGFLFKANLKKTFSPKSTMEMGLLIISSDVTEPTGDLVSKPKDTDEPLPIDPIEPVDPEE